MVNLTTTYDTLIHKRVFVLKGEEAYARTTNVIASLVYFNDSESAIANARYGLSIRVLGNIGDSSIVVYDNDKLLRLNDGSTLESITWYEDMDNATIPDGMTWDSASQTLTIGLETTETDYEDTGLALFYNVEHNIVVKYLGNEYCLKSKSSTITKTIDTPASFTTYVNVASNSTSYYQGDENAKLLITLLNGNDEPLSNKSLDVYVDDVSTGETLTTDNDGVCEYPISTIGAYEYEFKFVDGVNYYSSEGSLSVSYGYEIVGESLEQWVNGAGYLNATVTDYFGNPISNLTLSCNLDGTNIITATTNSSGEATLTNETTGLDISSLLTITDAYGDESNAIVVVPITLTSYDITSTTSETWVGGNTLQLTVSATGEDSDGNDISLEGFVVGLDNASTSSVRLNSNGTATCYYQPSGAGDVTVTATFVEDITDSFSITDYNCRWVNNTRYNDIYTTLENVVITPVSNGWRLYSSYGYLKLKDSYPTFELSYKYVSLRYTNVNIFGRYCTCNNGDRIRILYDGVHNQLYINDELVGIVGDGYGIQINGDTIIDDLALKIL